MEIPVAATVSTSIYLMLSGRFYWALAVNVIGLFIKDACSVLAIVNCIVILLLALNSYKSGVKRWGLACCAFVPLAIRFAVVSFVNAAGPSRMPVPSRFGFLSGFDHTLWLAGRIGWLLEPWLFVFAFFVGASALVWRRNNIAPSGYKSLLLSMNPVPRDFYCWAYCFSIVLVFVMAMFCMKVPLARYVVWYLPCLIVAMAAACKMLKVPERVVVGGGCCLILISVYNWNGRLMEPIGFQRRGDFLERSHEYRQDLADNMRTGMFIDSVDQAPTVVGLPLYRRMFSHPAYGYVSKQRRAIAPAISRPDLDNSIANLSLDEQRHSLYVCWPYFDFHLLAESSRHVIYRDRPNSPHAIELVYPAHGTPLKN